MTEFDKVSRVMGGAAIAGFISRFGRQAWESRMAELGREAGTGRWAARAVMQRHGVELSIQRLWRGNSNPTLAGDARIASLCADFIALLQGLPPAGRERLHAALQDGLSGQGTLVRLFHLLRTAQLQRSRGFTVHHVGFADGAPFDLLLTREATSAEIVCEVVSAEAGRDVHRGAWFRLVDRVDPDLQTWLSAHPGRYVLKMTLPQGLKADCNGAETLAALHGRIRTLLAGQCRTDHDEAAMIRLDPLLLAVAQAEDGRLMPRLRREFGPEAHLAVTAAANGVFVLAARAGREDEVAAAMRRHMAAVAAQRLTGQRPGILAMLIDDIDRNEWHGLRDRLELEGEARQFLTHPRARHVVAVTCSSRLELLGADDPRAAPDGDVRFRNPAHPAAKAAALAPAVLSSV